MSSSDYGLGSEDERSAESDREKGEEERGASSAPGRTRRSPEVGNMGATPQSREYVRPVTSSGCFTRLWQQGTPGDERDDEQRGEDVEG